MPASCGCAVEQRVRLPEDGALANSDRAGHDQDGTIAKAFQTTVVPEREVGPHSELEPTRAAARTRPQRRCGVRPWRDRSQRGRASGCTDRSRRESSLRLPPEDDVRVGAVDLHKAQPQIEGQCHVGREGAQMHGHLSRLREFH